MINKKNQEPGFSAVELLITLFIAAAFLVSGWQLYSLIIRDGGQTRADSKANNIAYDYLRRYSTSATVPCVIFSPLVNSPLSVSGLSNVTVSVDITCPKPNTSGISNVSVSVGYGTPQETVEYSTFVDSSDLGTTLEEGLLGWWPFNGNATDASSNSNDGTVNGAVLTTGQNGQNNSAYSFNGSSDYIELPGTWGGPGFSDISVSAWYYVNSDTGTYAAIVEPTTTEFVHMHLYSSGTGTVYTDTSNASPANAPQTPVGVWHHLVISSKSGQTVSYLDGAQLGSIDTTSFGYVASTSTLQIGRGYSSGRYFNGILDDIRIYDRALTATDVSALYALGAF